MKQLVLFLLVVIGFSSCTINRNVMFKTDHDYVFDTPSDSIVQEEYRISPTDVLLFRLFSNNGSKLLDITAGTADTEKFIAFPETTFLVEADGTVELPQLGEVYVKGLTPNEAEEKLEELYKQYYQEPFSILQVMNNRVVVFPGAAGQAKVINLINRNTTVIEALALSGGLADRGDARKVKLIRLIDGKREIYLMDLSTIEGMQYASLVVQANDVIYVEPVPEIAAEVMKDVAPYITLVSGVALIYAILIGAF